MSSNAATERRIPDLIRRRNQPTHPKSLHHAPANILCCFHHVKTIAIHRSHAGLLADRDHAGDHGREDAALGEGLAEGLALAHVVRRLVDGAGDDLVAAWSRRRSPGRPGSARRSGSGSAKVAAEPRDGDLREQGPEDRAASGSSQSFCVAPLSVFT